MIFVLWRQQFFIDELRYDQLDSCAIFATLQHFFQIAVKLLREGWLSH
jgi:hypothetical protein